MKQYLVIKSVMLLVGSKTYRKDAIITENEVGKDKIKRYLDRGYIKEVGKADKKAAPDKKADEQKKDDKAAQK